MNNIDKLLMIMGHTTNRLGIVYLYHRLRSQTQLGVPILLYHRVGTSNVPGSFEQTSTSEFEAEMRYLAKNYEVLELPRIIQCLQTGEALPKKSIVITFDDGYKDNYLNAYPLLKKYHLPATIFLTTGYIDSPELFWWDKLRYLVWHSSVNKIELDQFGSYPLYSKIDRNKAVTNIERKLKQSLETTKNELMNKLADICRVDIPSNMNKEWVVSWDEVREMSRNNIGFGAHTVTHPIMTKISLEKVRWEVTESKRRIEAELEQPINTFSYPNGHPDDYNNDIKQILREAGFNCALAASPSKVVVQQDELFQLNRISIGSDIDQFKFSLELLPGIRSLVKSD